MLDTNTFQQLQKRIAEMERCHKEELRKMKAHHNQLEACARHPHGDEHSANILPERTQGELHPRRTVNTQDDPKRYDGTTDPDEHLDAFLTQENLYTNDDAIMCRVFLMSLKRETLTWYDRLPPTSINSFDTLVECFSAQYATNRSHRMTLAALASLQQADDEFLQKFMDKFGCIAIQIQNFNPEVALHSMLLALWPDNFADSLWEKCSGSGMKFDKSDISTTSEKEAPRSTHTSQTRGTSQTSVSLSQKGPGMSITHP
ncbi:hypothetical protein JHK87_007005 [Glycine soja]|nr:hypothetical protein JHK87_007005 [Glycine soja]